MKTYGLLGKRLLHSLAPEIHRELGNLKYDLFEVMPDELDEFFRRKEFAGLNVTFPYKKDVMRYCDIVTEKAQRIGSVDIITVDSEGKLTGDNCEYDGFCHMLEKCGIDVPGRKVLILGDGSSALTVYAVAADKGAAEIITVSMDEILDTEEIYSHCDAEIVINTTTVGVYPNNGEYLIDLHRFPKLCGVLELINNPRRTRLVCEAEDLNVPNSDGLAMLVAQAYATEIKFGRIQHDEELRKATYKTMSDRRKNIIFVGLPGCGKTTIAKVVAAKLSRPCIDIDHMIEMKAGMPASSIYHAYGESYYRELETETLRKITRNGGQVISTHSAVVMREENRYYLRQNGYIVWLSREFEELRFRGQYLARNIKALTAIDNERTPHYKALADIHVEVTNNVEKTVSEIIERMDIKETPKLF